MSGLSDILQSGSLAYSRPTPASVAARRELARQLQQTGSIQNAGPLGALANILSGGFAGYENAQAARDEQQGQSTANAAIANALKNPNPSFSDLVGVATDPWQSSSGSALASALLGKQIDQAYPQTTANQSDFNFAQTHPGFDTFLHTQSGGDETWGLTPQAYQVPGPDGKPTIQVGVMSNRGNFKPVPLPDGASPVFPVTQLNQKTQFTGVDKYGNPTGQPAIPIDNSQAAFDTGIGELNAKNLGSQQGDALDAVTSLQSTQEALNLLDKGVITGFGANFKLGLGKALQQVGFHGADDPITNTEAFVAQRVAETGRLIKMFGSGTGLSDADREYASKAAAGQISLDESSIRKILEINQRAAQTVIGRYNTRLQDVGANGGGLGSMAITPPAAGGGGSMLPDPLGMMGR